MTPFHPKLRSALLRDPAHLDQGLTIELLMHYENLVIQYYYLEHYPRQQQQTPGRQNNVILVEPTSEDILEEIKRFSDRYMPNFKEIHEKWVANQRNALKRSYHDLNPMNILKIALRFLGAWFLAAIFCRVFKFAKFSFCKMRDFYLRDQARF
jgi:hypothetical protein